MTTGCEVTSEVLPGLVLVLIILMQVRYWHMTLTLRGVARRVQGQLREARAEARALKDSPLLPRAEDEA